MHHRTLEIMPSSTNNREGKLNMENARLTGNLMNKHEHDVGRLNLLK